MLRIIAMVIVFFTFLSCGNVKSERLNNAYVEKTYDLKTNVPPSKNFDLRSWNLSLPIDKDHNGRADSIPENTLSKGYEHPKYFYTAEDGGMVFKCYLSGARTSTNTKYTRSEFREMLRRGNTRIGTRGVNANNWVFSSAPKKDQKRAGAVDGRMSATLAINYVSVSGDENEVGRVVIGQIHANDDEPVRLYYRKLPHHTKGGIYFAHEPLGEEDVYVDMLGIKNQAENEPVNGIALDEKFSYEIEVVGNLLTVHLIRVGHDTITKQHDMSASGYDKGKQYMYFKAGVYNQNKTGHPRDYVQATFYALDVDH